MWVPVWCWLILQNLGWAVVVTPQAGGDCLEPEMGLGALRIVKVKNWSEFQHYKDRCPPWIKLHHELLDNYEFHCLPVASRALAPMIWLLASESKDGSLPCDLEKISFRLHQSRNELVAALRPLISKGFIVLEQNDSVMLAERKQSAVPETEAETYKQETEGEGEKQIPEPPPEAQHPLNHARRMVEMLGLSERIFRSVEAGIVAEINFTGDDIADCSQRIYQAALAQRTRGTPIDKFWFDDTKWRPSNGKQPTGVSKGHERSERSKANILDGIARDISRRNAPVHVELENGTRKRVGSGI